MKSFFGAFLGTIAAILLLGYAVHHFKEADKPCCKEACCATPPPKMCGCNDKCKCVMPGQGPNAKCDCAKEKSCSPDCKCAVK